MRKKLVSSLLCGALLAGLLVSPAAATFPDVTDPELTEAVEVLRQLEVVNGKPDGTFDPAGTFTRGEFCKMALTILGRAEERQLYTGRVIFSDVTAAHWALGWINAAAAVREGVTPLVRGRGDGTFAPDAPITSGEAVTILMRCLGYTDQDVGGDGGTWYAGHMARAKSIELLKGLEDLSGGETLTRAQAALLFENLLYTPGKGSPDIFLKSVLGGSITDSQLILSVGSKELSTGGYAVRTSQGTYKTYRTYWSEDLLGKQVKLVLNADGEVLAIQPDDTYINKNVKVETIESRYLMDENGNRISVDASTPVWKGGESFPYLDEDNPGFLLIRANSEVTLCYDELDNLLYIYIPSADDSIVAVAKDASRPFDGAWEGNPTAVYKNGLKSSLSDVKPYDVGTYDSRTGVLELSDKKLTGVYENAVPSPVSPDTVTVMGCEGIEVLDCALSDLSRFQLGDRVTLLLDRQNRVAGVVNPQEAQDKTLGLACVVKGGQDSLGQIYTATVTTTGGLTLKGRVRISDEAMQTAPGKLWEVRSDKVGWLELVTPASASAPGDWDVKAMTLGSAKVSPWAAIYDKVESGQMVKVDMDAVTLGTVPAGKIAFVHLDGAGAVDTLVLRDVTGDGYTYGVTDYVQGSRVPSQWGGLSASTPNIVTLTNGAGELKLVTAVNFAADGLAYAGVAPALFTRSGENALAGYRTLTAYQGVHRTDFGEDSVRIDGVEWPLAGNIDSGCYNGRSETWFKSLDAALSYASTLTVYCDRSPAEGGKVRLVVAE